MPPRLLLPALPQTASPRWTSTASPSRRSTRCLGGRCRASRCWPCEQGPCLFTCPASTRRCAPPATIPSTLARLPPPLPTLPLPPQIDYVRVYQDPEAVNVGCSPPDFPTEQYIAWCAAGGAISRRLGAHHAPFPVRHPARAALPSSEPLSRPLPALMFFLHLPIACSNRDTYVINQEDQVLIPAACDKLPSCRSDWSYEYQVGWWGGVGAVGCVGRVTMGVVRLEMQKCWCWSGWRGRQGACPNLSLLPPTSRILTRRAAI